MGDVERRIVENNVITKETQAKDTEHMKAYERIMMWFSLVGALFGIKLKFDSVPTKLFAFWIAPVSIAFAASQFLHMQLIHYKNHNFKRILEPFALYGQLLANIVQIYGFKESKQQILSLMFFPGKLCRENVDGTRAEILRTGFLRSFAILKVYIISIMACILFFVTVPLNEYISNGEWSTLIPIEIVFCDQSTVAGFIGANIVQAYFGCFSAINNMFFGSVFINLILNYTLQMTLIAEDFKDLGKMWMIPNKTSLAYKRAYLINIWRKNQDAFNYLASIKMIYEHSHFLYFCFNFFAQILCLFEITYSNFTTGYALALAIFIQMMSYCVMGSQISISVDNFCFAVYDTNWYTYDLKSQMMLQCLLQHNQRIKDISIGPLAPLNVISGIKVVKSIYSYYVVMTEIL